MTMLFKNKNWVKPSVLLLVFVVSINAQALVVYPLVTLGNAGNNNDPTTGFGAVSYDYQIGVYEVTIAQYTEFLNAVAQTDDHKLYNSNMTNLPGETAVNLGFRLAAPV